MIYTSKSAKGFFDDEVMPVESMPSDIAEISREDWVALLTAEQSGKVIDWSGDQPAATDKAPEWQDVQAWARSEIEFSDRVWMDCMKAGVTYPSAWRTRDTQLRAFSSAESGDPNTIRPARPPMPSID